MKQFLPAPGVSTALFLAWLMLNGSFSAGHLILGALLALAIPWSLRRMRPQSPTFTRPEVALRLAFVVAKDIVVSGLGVGRRILGPEAAIRPRFVWLPLSIRDPHGIAALAGIVTMTPGTLSAEIAEDRSHLLIHAFDLDDEAALVADIRRRYEAPLRIVFGELRP
jgi:multicomponent K+:H+ antiporter subunit E